MSGDDKLKLIDVEVTGSKLKLRQAALVAAQLFFPGLAHLFVHRIFDGIVFLVAWAIIWSLYIALGQWIRLLLLIWPIVAILHLLTCKEFPHKRK